jgi:hypothetical protein
MPKIIAGSSTSSGDSSPSYTGVNLKIVQGTTSADGLSVSFTMPDEITADNLLAIEEQCGNNIIRRIMEFEHVWVTELVRTCLLGLQLQNLPISGIKYMDGSGNLIYNGYVKGSGKDTGDTDGNFFFSVSGKTVTITSDGVIDGYQSMQFASGITFILYYLITA